jgi:large subunit ribosomal protein L21
MFDQMYALLVAESTSGGIPWWVWVILIIILLVLLWFWFGREEEEVEAPVVESRSSEIEIEPEVEPEPAPAQPAKPDDLKKIEGIGPKVSSLLNEAGIMTFQQMVDTGAEKLETILDEAGLHMLDADTWPEQAQLAAAGDWDGLKKLQDELKGGKRAS